MTNQKLIKELLADLEIEAVERARDAERITDVQAKRLIEKISNIKDIQANPLYHIQDQNGQLIGEIATSENGTIFTALRYGSHAVNRSSTFMDYDDAVKFISDPG